MGASRVVTVLFGQSTSAELEEMLKSSQHVWVQDTDSNRKVRAFLTECMDLAHLPGNVSSVPLREGETSTEWLQKTLELVDMHHDGSLWPEWSVIEVRGIALTAEIRAVAEAFGIVGQERHSRGFQISED